MKIQNINNNLYSDDVIPYLSTEKITHPKNFYENFTNALKKTSANERNIFDKINNSQIDESNSSLNDIMVDLQKISISIQFLVQVKNKLVESYQEIMNMQI
ncbi:flagellar hook-basal body complex protein FliE [Buchnera aphidicola str. Bp (Baizongia pistaciae)]|uniref:Flagellar hook-basal body complex protein FliE n=1 Tax=Buchnera aphidicola subsp. Baizongia pistaciae (strain Bp) TaxID=224915 RepID=FLIE_BUCBP|nr:flagellar hook-basal body complex protein FliE [Buchnera aphidicola]Q89B01.1 RecName: Full=Flagellar hook-basal body complex protein FliE [Buchnera aphidicola str. Bp (Baizongia pistaciae)]AAO26803.1 flagellar hook-basal body complex protein FliE [Buchnera aphidicola str. Bp (Baizongia pistaciae)]